MTSLDPANAAEWYYTNDDAMPLDWLPRVYMELVMQSVAAEPLPTIGHEPGDICGSCHGAGCGTCGYSGRA